MNLVNALPIAGHSPSAEHEAACYRPARALAGQGWTCAGYEERLAVPVTLRKLPSSTLTLALGFGDPVRLAHGQSAEGHQSLVIGLYDTANEFTLGGRQRGLVLRCDPVLAYSLLGVPLGLVGRTTLNLDTILGQSAAQLAERLASARDWDDRFDTFEETLSTLLANGPRADPAVVWTWQRLRAGAGDMRIEALAARLGWSRRHLVRKFHQQIGIAPKTAARILRFERATRLLAHGSWNLAQVAAHAGYADQAHLSREVRALTGRTPSEFAVELRTSTAA